MCLQLYNYIENIDSQNIKDSSVLRQCSQTTQPHCVSTIELSYLKGSARLHFSINGFQITRKSN